MGVKFNEYDSSCSNRCFNNPTSKGLRDTNNKYKQQKCCFFAFKKLFIFFSKTIYKCNSMVYNKYIN